LNQLALTVLIVEDEFDNQQIISHILNYYGFDATVVGNGLECLAVLEQMIPSVVIMDLAMPKMDGWETLIAIRANPRTANIPVVAITAFHSDEVARGVNAAGFNAYFRKPLNPMKFVDQLQKAIGIPPKTF